MVTVSDAPVASSVPAVPLMPVERRVSDIGQNSQCSWRSVADIPFQTETEASGSEATPMDVRDAPVTRKVVGAKAAQSRGAKLASAVPQDGNTGTGRGAKRTMRVQSLTPPSTAAVVVTLREEAAGRGETYGSALAKAKQRIQMSELDINKITVRKTVTGARIFEIPGSQRGAKADRLAERLREAISEVAQIDRPVKSADLRISRLEDSVSVEELVATMASTGGCPEDRIKASSMWVGRDGFLTCYVKVPVVAAKKILNGGIMVGLSTPVVETAESRPLRCFRCLTLGHTRMTCTAEAERCQQCFRCGTAGHVASACAAVYHCSACSAAGKPAVHKMGGRACRAPPPKKKALSAAGGCSQGSEAHSGVSPTSPDGTRRGSSQETEAMSS